MKKLLFLVVVAAAALAFRAWPRSPVLLSPPVSDAASSYAFSPAFLGNVSVFDENLGTISHMEITPDGRSMLVATLPGTVWIYHKTDSGFVRQKDPFFSVETAQPGWPPQEAGLTGIALGADFEVSGDVFFLYSFAFEKGSFRNRVVRVQFTKRGSKIVGASPKNIFEATTPGTGSHQIQDGVGVMVRDIPHLMFIMGEGFVAARALDPKEEAGKLMLITRDGEGAAGERPFDENPKVQGLGLRNPPAIARNPKSGKLAIADTGPSSADRFIYGSMYDPDGKNTHALSFNWDGEEDSLQKDAPDLYDGGKNMIIHRWTPTETAVNIAFYENEKLPALPQGSYYALVTLFGRTGEKGNEPGKKIMLATLSEGLSNAISFQPFILRVPGVADELGHPIGLAVDPETKDLYFGDIIEGRIYKAVAE